MNRRDIIKSALGFLGLGGAALAESTQLKETQKANNEISFKKEDQIYYLKNNELYLVETFAKTLQHKEVLIARHWYKNGLLHRDEDLPAVEYPSDQINIKEWYKNGNKYRENGLYTRILKTPNEEIQYWENERGLVHRDDDLPAIVHSNGDKEWWKNGKRHRNFGLPAIEKSDSKQWLFDGKRHRDNLPAIEYLNGDYDYWCDGKRHREDGPAIYRNHGEITIWFKHGNPVDKYGDEPELESKFLS